MWSDDRAADLGFRPIGRDFLSWYEAWLDRGLGSVHPASPENAHRLAAEYQSAGANREAIALLEAIPPQELRSKLPLARAYVGAARYEDADRCCRELIDSGDPWLANHGYTILLGAHEATGDLDRATRLAVEAVRQGMPAVEFYPRLAEMARKASRFDEAERWLRQALSLAERTQRAAILERLVAVFEETHRDKHARAAGRTSRAGTIRRGKGERRRVARSRDSPSPGRTIPGGARLLRTRRRVQP